MENKDKIEIPFGAKDSELCECEYTIPEGYKAEIKDGKVIIRKKESEDENIRNTIFDCLYKCCDSGIITREQRCICIAWLEKQGEHANFRNKIQIGDRVTRNEDGVLVNLSQLKRAAKPSEKQGEQNPEEIDNLHNYLYGEQKPAENSCKNSDDITTEEKDMTEYKKGFECGKQRVLKYPEDFGLCKKPVWSEEDESRITTICTYLQDYARLSGSESRTIRINEYCDWLKSLKDRVLPQPKQEWSEEDKEIIQAIITDVKYAKMKHKEIAPETYDEELDWLKSLRLQSHWKPSIAQLNALSIVSKGNAPDDIEAIVSLYNDLKKLKG